MDEMLHKLRHLHRYARADGLWDVNVYRAQSGRIIFTLRNVRRDQLEYLIADSNRIVYISVKIPIYAVRFIERAYQDYAHMPYVFIEFKPKEEGVTHAHTQS